MRLHAFFLTVGAVLAGCGAGGGSDGGLDAQHSDATMMSDGDSGSSRDVASMGDGDANTSTAPQIVITSPMQGATVMADAMHHVPVSFTVSNFNLMPEGNCGGMPNCGHVDLTIDGAACGNPYNTIGASSPMIADFSRCPATMQTGMHTIQLELRDDNFQPLTPPATAYVMVTVM